jgi:murein L,D-transpeptidase YafK
MKYLILVIFSIVINGNSFANYSNGQKASNEKTISKLIVYKSKRQLLVYSNDKLINTYTISLGKNPVGHKQFEGDNKTPEGTYKIDSKDAKSKYHKSLHINYPNNADYSFAKSKGKSPGGAILIHGLPNSFKWLQNVQKVHRLNDWTKGCIALTDEEIDELFHNVKIGTPIIIYP